MADEQVGLLAGNWPDSDDALFVAGDRDAEFDFEIAATDWQTSVPYSVNLDLSDALPGQMVAIVAVGDTGIAATGEFAASPVIIGG